MSLDEAAYLDKDPKEIMAAHGKSFYWASHIFSKKRFEDVALLYAFCRYVDDTADETHPSEAKGALEKLKRSFGLPIMNCSMKGSQLLQAIRHRVSLC